MVHLACGRLFSTEFSTGSYFSCFPPPVRQETCWRESMADLATILILSTFLFKRRQTSGAARVRGCSEINIFTNHHDGERIIAGTISISIAATTQIGNRLVPYFTCHLWNTTKTLGMFASYAILVLVQILRGDTSSDDSIFCPSVPRRVMKRCARAVATGADRLLAYSLLPLSRYLNRCGSSAAQNARIIGGIRKSASLGKLISRVFVRSLRA